MSTMPWDEQEKDCPAPDEVWVVEGRVNQPGKPWRFAAAVRNAVDADDQCRDWNAQPPQAYAYRVRRYIPAALRGEEEP